jgi:hypothetical protein
VDIVRTYYANDLAASDDIAFTGAYRMCYEVFNTEQGSCCKLTTMNNTFSAQMTPVVTAWDSFNKELVYVRRRILYVRSLYSRRTRDEIRAYVTEMTEISNFKPALDGLSVSKILSILESFFTFEPDMKKFRESGKYCFDRGLYFRGQIMCYACASGDTYKKYFVEEFDAVETTKLKSFTFKWNTNSCQNLAIDCVTSWKFISNAQLFLQITYMLEHYTKSFIYDKDEDGLETRTPDLTLLTNVYNKMNLYYSGKTHGEVQNALEVCPTGETDDTCSKANLQTICSAFFNFLYGEIGSNIKKVVDFEATKGEFNSTTEVQTKGLTQVDDAPGNFVDLLMRKGMTPPKFTTRRDLEFWAAGGIKSAGKLQVQLIALLTCLLVLALS